MGSSRLTRSNRSRTNSQSGDRSRRISVTTVDLSEILGSAAKLGERDARLVAKIAEIQAYADTRAVPPAKLAQMARLGVVLDAFVAAHHLDATAIQCWTSLQANHGCNVCTEMSMMSEQLLPSACEVDVTGVLTMYAMQLASGSPSALVDWNNNYGAAEDKCVLFHCGNWAKSFLPDIKVLNAPILGSTASPGLLTRLLVGPEKRLFQFDPATLRSNPFLPTSNLDRSRS